MKQAGEETHDTTALIRLALGNGWDYPTLIRVARELAGPMPLQIHNHGPTPRAEPGAYTSDRFVPEPQYGANTRGGNHDD